MKKVIICALTTLLVGCDWYNIYSVKNVVMDDIDNTIKLGNALGNRSMCSDVAWIPKKDIRGRALVKYECKLSGFYGPIYKIYDARPSPEKDKATKQLIEYTTIRDDLLKQKAQLDTIDVVLSDIRDRGLDRRLSLLRATHRVDIDYSYLFKDQQSYSLIPIPSYFRDSRAANVDLKEVEAEIKGIFDENKVLPETKKWFKLDNKANGGIDPFNLTKLQWDSIRGDYDRVLTKSINNAEIDVNKTQQAIEKLKGGQTPDTFTQTVVFSVDNEKPTLVDCYFEASLPKEPYDVIMPDAEEGLTDKKVCLKMAYSYDYDTRYEKMFEKLINMYLDKPNAPK